MAELGTPSFITIHCAATPEGRDVAAQTIEGWDIAKFGQKSYHYIVLLDGTIHQSLSDNQLGAHVHLRNHHNLGVCYVGGVDVHGNPKDTRTPAQKAAIRALVSRLQLKFPTIKEVKGHRAWPDVHKACPSFDVKTEL